MDFPAHDGIPASSRQYSYDLQPGMGFNTGGTAIPILHRTGVRDRLGKWTWYGRDRLGRIVAVKDPLNRLTTYTYCGCGGPGNHHRRPPQSHHLHLQQRRRENPGHLPGRHPAPVQLRCPGRLAYVDDGLGQRTYGYNNQGLLNLVAGPFGTERSVTYNLHDQPTTVVDANGVNVTQTFDRLNRLLTRQVPGQGTESFQYSARGLTNYTGPDSKVTRYVYDAAGRKTSEITPKNETIGYTYNTASDLLTLTDGRGKVTTWTYDIEGLVRTKRYHGQSFANLEYAYDANGRLAWRKFWSSPTQSQQTLYSYDEAGNLTGINYPASPDVSFTYNAVNQVATMSDAAGTTTFTYTDAGHLASEDGPWASDTVTSSYHATAPRLRTGLTVQQPSGSWAHTYGYDAARRLRTITGPAGTFTYTHKGPGTVWTNLALPNTSAITNAFDTGGRLTGIWLRNNAGTILNKHVYLYNGYGQRQRQTLTDNGYTTYGYDDDAQLTSSLGYTSGGSPHRGRAIDVCL